MACYDYDLCNSLRNQVGLSQYFSSGLAAHGSSLITPGPPDYVNITTNASTDAVAEQFVSYVFGNGSDYMKIVSNQGGPDLATQSALVSFAHAQGKTTMTHATLLEFYNPAILSNTNGLQHSPGDGLLSSDMISLMVNQSQFVTPTMEIARLVLDISNTFPAVLIFLGQGTASSYEPWRANVVAMHQAGIPILAGTDAADIIPINGSAYGWTLHEELANLVDAGLTTGEALRSATLIPSLQHNLTTRGRIAPGMRADLILLSPGADPVQDIGATKNLSRVWIGGVEYEDVAQQPFLNSSTITIDPAVLAALL
jgi:imidazolonepropionase-like amidohydrolase